MVNTASSVIDSWRIYIPTEVILEKRMPATSEAEVYRVVVNVDEVRLGRLKRRATAFGVASGILLMGTVATAVALPAYVDFALALLLSVSGFFGVFLMKSRGR